ncbi:MAG: flagellar motor protein MotD [Methylococcales bacterium]|nr:flagellar motor protein MotD [Methylococcales bacterium]
MAVMRRPARRRDTRDIDPPQNPDRWLLSYADFITLLFAFFVVLYAFSSVNEIKYRQVAIGLQQAFSKSDAGSAEHDSSGPRVIQPIQVGRTPTWVAPITPTEQEQQQQQVLSEHIVREQRMLNLTAEQFVEVLEPFIDQDLIAVKRSDFWVELQMNSELLFASGEANLSVKAEPILAKVAEIVRRLPNMITVEGYTDDVPINTPEFPSNWELSGARAARVVRHLIQHGIAAERLASVGYAEYHPIADNATEPGRNRNRRVVLVVLSDAFARYGANEHDRAEVLNWVSQQRDLESKP